MATEIFLYACFMVVVVGIVSNWRSVRGFRKLRERHSIIKNATVKVNLTGSVDRFNKKMKGTLFTAQFAGSNEAIVSNMLNKKSFRCSCEFLEGLPKRLEDALYALEKNLPSQMTDDNTPVTIFENEKGHKVWFTDEALKVQEDAREFDGIMDEKVMMGNQKTSICGKCFQDPCKCDGNFYCGDEVDYGEQCGEQCNMCRNKVYKPDNEL